MTVAAFLPLARARGSIETGQDVFIQSVNRPFPINRTGELVFHVLVPPKLARGKLIVRWIHFKSHAASPVASRKEDSIRPDLERLRDVPVPLQDDPRKLPEQLAVIWVQPHRPLITDDDQLQAASQFHHHRRTVSGFIILSFPDCRRARRSDVCTHRVFRATGWVGVMAA